MIINTHHLKTPIQIIDTQLDIPQKYKQECIDEIYKIGNSVNDRTNLTALRSTYYVWDETKVLDPLLKQIRNIINQILGKDDLQEYNFEINNAWSAIYKKGHYANMHRHFPHHFSFVYYLKSNGKTPLIFNDINFILNVKDDMLVVFPSNLNHSVPPHKEDKDRICIAGNINLENKIKNNNKPSDEHYE